MVHSSAMHKLLTKKAELSHTNLQTKNIGLQSKRKSNTLY